MAKIIYIHYNIIKRKATNNNFSKEFFKFLLRVFKEKTKENLRNRFHIKPVKSDGIQLIEIIIIKSTFRGFKSYGNFDCLAFKNQTISFKEPNFLGYCPLSFSEVHN